MSKEKKTVWDESFGKVKAEEIQFPSKLAVEIEELFKKNLPKGAKVLEAGSGAGEISGWLSKKGFESTLLDESKVAIDLSKSFYKLHKLKGEFVQGDLFKIPFKDNAFDCVWNSGVMEHFSAEDIISGIKEMGRVSKDYVIVIVPNAKAIFYRLAKWNLEKNKEWAAGEEYPKASMKPYFEEAGISPIFEDFLAVDWGVEWVKNTTKFENRELYETLRDFRNSLEDDALFKDSLAYLLVCVGSKKKKPSLIQKNNQCTDELKAKDAEIDLITSLSKIKEDILNKKIATTEKDYATLKEGEEWLKGVVKDKEKEIENIKISRTYKAGSKLAGAYKTLTMSKNRVVTEPIKSDQEESQASNIMEKISKVKIPKKMRDKFKQDGNVVNIVSYSFFDKDGSGIYLGGAERYLLDLSKIISNYGYRIRIFQMGNKNIWEKKIEKNIEVFGLPVDHDSLADLFHTLINPDSLVIYSPFTLASQKMTKSIGISHGVFWDVSESQQKKDSFRQFYQEITNNISNCKALVSVDTNTINSIRSTNAELADRFFYIPNYVDTKVFKPKEKSDKDIVILYPRRLYKPRGFYLLLNSLDKIIKIDKKIKIHFVGQADPKEQEIMEKLKKFKERISWSSYDSDEMYKAYQSADITLVPTVASEGTSLSCLEAMACGNAVIATNVGGLPDLILDGYNGLLISPKEEELVKAIERLVTNKDYRKQLSKNAVLVAQNFSKKRWTEEWEKTLSYQLKKQ